MGILLRLYLPGYIQEKAKNLATKEDVGDITRKIESVKVEYAGELERLKAELRRSGFQEETQFAHLYERRAEVLIRLYNKLGRARLYTEISLKYPSNHEVRNRAGKSLISAGLYFSEYKLLIPQQLANVVSRVFSLSAGLLADPSTSGTEIVSPTPEAWKKFEVEAPGAMEQIEIQIRQLLGDKHD
ncbi:hypothetical protein [Longimicrobium sp.]|uniref:hypothetical protein n=1 Tax=Longimicrobium sp. TaxID=2029185 RepID=UPI002D804936|nr:hypothetical protein [Longimicrobium sp.]